MSVRACVRARVFFYILLQTSASALELTPTLMQWVPRFGFLSRAEREVNLSSPFCTDVMNEWSHASVHLLCL